MHILHIIYDNIKHKKRDTNINVMRCYCYLQIVVIMVMHSWLLFFEQAKMGIKYKNAFKISLSHTHTIFK